VSRAVAAGEPSEDTAGEPPIRGFLHRPAGGASGRSPEHGLVLTHGAGSDCHAPLLVALGQRLAERGVLVLRVDLPFRQARRRGPPSPAGAARDRAGLRRALGWLRGQVPGPVWAGGVSYGGRQASLLAAEEPGAADGLVLLSYPLHPPGRPEAVRTGHLPRLALPVLVAHGTADPFGNPAEMRAACAFLPGPVEILLIEGAGHGLGRGRGRPPDPATVERVVSAFVALAGAAPGSAA
jgi:hypothetical protein